MIAVALAVPALARSRVPTLVRVHPNNDHLNAAERYAWGQIRQGLTANFTEKCDDWLDPKQKDDPGWRDEKKCRTLSAAFIVDILTKPALRDSIHYKGIDVRGAKIVGDVDLAFAKIERPVQISESRFEGGISLRNAHANSIVALEGSVVQSPLDASELHAEGDLILSRATLSARLTLSRATIAGVVDMTGATCEGDMEASSLQVGDFFMRSNSLNVGKFKGVNLLGAKVVGDVDLSGASFDGELHANKLYVGGSLHMDSNGENKATFNKVNLGGANVIDLPLRFSSTGI